MKVTISKSKNAESFYIGKSYINDQGKSTTVTIRKLGTLKDLLKEHGPTRDDVLAWAREEAKIETKKYKEEQKNKAVQITFHADRQISYDQQVFYRGGYLFLQAFYYRIGLDKTCRKLRDKYQFKYDINAILSDLIYARILEPASKLSSYKIASEFLEKPSYQLHDVYRALDVLGNECDFIQSEVYKNSHLLGKRNDKILFYDCTNFYFETEEEDEDLNKKAKKQVFLPGINIVVSNGKDDEGNYIGKSTLLKSIFHALGADAFFPKDHNWEVYTKNFYILKFNLDSVPYKIMRRANVFYVYDKNDSLIFKCNERIKLSEFYSKLFGFLVLLKDNNRNKEYTLAQPFSYFALNFVDQIGYKEKTGFLSFDKINQYTKIYGDLIFSHMGIDNEKLNKLYDEENQINNELSINNEEKILLNKILKTLNIDENIPYEKIEVLKQEISIHKEEYDNLKITKVTMGLGYSNIKGSLELLDEDLEITIPVDFKSPVNLATLYTQDSKTQYILSKNDEYSASKISNEALNIYSDEYKEYTDDNIDEYAIDIYNSLNGIYGEYDISTFISDLAFEYDLDMENTRLIIHPNFSIVYEIGEDIVKIGAIEYNDRVLLKNHYLDISDRVIMQISLALKQISNNKKIYIIRQKDEHIFDKIMNCNELLEKEKGFNR